MKFAGTIHVEHIVHELEPLCTVQRLGLYAQPVKIVQQVVLDVGEPRLDLTHTLALNAKGNKFGLCQTIIAFGKLLAQHLRILRTNIVKAIFLIRDADAFLKLRTVRCHIHKGQFKLDRAVKEVQKTAPFLENRSLILLLRQLIVDVLIGNRPGVIIRPQTSAAWGWTAVLSGEPRASAAFSCRLYRSFSKTAWVTPPFISSA